MNLIAVVDNRGGMLFHDRRQSQDRILREFLLKETSESILWMNAYSFSQFQNMDNAAQIKVSEHFMEKADEGDFCFVETLSVAPYEARIEEIWLLKWNRNYPGDFFFDIRIEEPNWICRKSVDFPGSSHEKISMRIYHHET